MKVKSLLLFSLTFCLTAFTPWKRDFGEKSKKINKTFQVDEQDVVGIRNSFGRIYVSSWDEPTLEVEAEVIVRSRYDDRIEDMLEGIKIDFDERGNGVFMRSEVEVSTKNNEEFEINFTLKLPRSNPLDIKNSFGDIYLGDRSGEVEIELDYGELKAGDLSMGGELKLSFVKADINSFANGQIVLRYCDYFSLDETNEIELDQHYSEIEIDQVNSIDMRSRYGQAEFGIVGDMEVNVQFTDFTIESLLSSLDMSARYATDFSLDHVSRNFNFIDIEGNYGSYSIELEDGLQANFKGDFKYASMRTMGVDIDYSLRMREQGKESYEAKIGGGHQNKRIQITSTYGDLRLIQ